MKFYKIFAIGMLVCSFFALLVGCSSSELVDIWSDSSTQSPTLKKMLVISVLKNPAQRRLWEDAFSAALEKHGVAATPSYRSFPDAVPDTDQVLQMEQTNGFDGVLVTRRLPSETNPQYLEGYVTTENAMRYDRRRERFVSYYRDIEHAGYVDSQKVIIRAIDVWATRNDGQMIWSGTSKTPESSTIQVVRPDIVKLVIDDLTQKGIIASEH